MPASLQACLAVVGRYAETNRPVAELAHDLGDVSLADVYVLAGLFHAYGLKEHGWICEKYARLWMATCEATGRMVDRPDPFRFLWEKR